MQNQSVQISHSLPAAVGRHLRAKMIAGVLALIPLVATFLILRLVFNAIDGTVQPLVKQAFGREIVGVGIGITVVAVYLMGLLVANFLGRAFIRWGESLILRIPIARWIYTFAKSIVDALSQTGKTPSRVVLVEWPRAGAYALGFLTSSVVDGDGKTYHNVLIPNTPTPQAGLLAIVPEEEVIFTDMTLDEAIKMVVSSGVITPGDLMKQVKKAARASASARGAEPTLAKASPGAKGPTTR